MLRALYDWTLSLAARKTAVLWLAAIAFIESSVFLIPADVLFRQMGLARPERAYRYALIATLAWALRSYGEPIHHFIGNRLGLIAAASALIVIVLYLAAKYLGTSGSLFQC